MARNALMPSMQTDQDGYQPEQVPRPTVQFLSIPDGTYGKQQPKNYKQGYINPDAELSAYIDAAYGTPHEAYLSGTAVPNGFTRRDYLRAFQNSLMNPAVALGLDGSKSTLMSGWPEFVSNAIGYYDTANGSMFVRNGGGRHRPGVTLAHEAAHAGLYPLGHKGHDMMSAFDRRAKDEFNMRTKDVLQSPPDTLTSDADPIVSIPSSSDTDVAWNAAINRLMERRPYGGPR